MSTPYGNLTEKTSEALQQALSEAMQRRNPALEPAHLLHGLLTQEGGVTSSLFRRAGKDDAALATAVAGQLARLPKLAQASGQPGLSSETHALLLKAKDEAETMKDDFVSAEHVLLALAEAPSLRPAFAAVGFDRKAILALSERFGVSRTPIREALRRLSAQGLVSFTPNRGVRVRTLSRDELREAFLALNTQGDNRIDLDELTAACPRGCTHAAEEPECGLDAALATGTSEAEDVPSTAGRHRGQLAARHRQPVVDGGHAHGPAFVGTVVDAALQFTHGTARDQRIAVDADEAAAQRQFQFGGNGVFDIRFRLYFFIGLGGPAVYQRVLKAV